MKNKKIEWCIRIGIGVVLFTLICAANGCVTTVDPQTGVKTVMMDPDAAATIDGVADVAEPLVTAAGIIFPGFAALSGLILGLIGMWRKLKPQVVAEREARDMNYIVLSGLVTAIEDYKKEDSEGWANLKAVLGDRATLTAENMIGEIRNIYRVGKRINENN